MNRRKFVLAGSAGLAGAWVTSRLLSSRGAEAFAAPAPLATKVAASDTITLGKTGIRTTRLAMGTGTSGFGHRSNQTALGMNGLGRPPRRPAVLIGATVAEILVVGALVLGVALAIVILEITLSLTAAVLRSMSILQLILGGIVISTAAYFVRDSRRPHHGRPRGTSSGERTPITPRTK